MASLLGKVRALEFAVRRLENRTKVYVYIDVTSIGLTAATATCRAIKNNMNLNSRLVLGVAGGNFPMLDTPPRVDSGAGTQSGTIVFEANQFAPGRFMCWFYNENGTWHRYFNDAYASNDPRYDSGWVWENNCGMQQQISTADLSRKYGGKLANIIEPGEYFLAGSTVNTATDSPYGSTGSPAIYLEVKRMQLDRGLIHTIRSNVTARESYEGNTTSAGVFGGFKQKLVAGVPFRQDIQTQHVSPRAAGFNLGGSPAASRYTTVYLVNNPDVSSDSRLKEQVDSIPQWLIDFCMSNEIKRYHMKSGGTECFGIIITDEVYEQVNQHTDGLIAKGDDGFYSVRYADWQNILLEGLRRMAIN